MRAAVLLVMVGLAAPARADDTVEVLSAEAEQWGRQLVLKLDVFSFDDDVRPALLPGVGFDAGLDLDIAGRKARVRVGAGDASIFSLHLDAHVLADRGAARARVVVQLGVAGTHLQLALPDVRISPQSVYGQSAVVLVVPLIESRF